jgi:transcriptional repressor NrdR
MRCPYCEADDDKVVESRTINEGDVIRRRRECLKCGERFTSYERIEPRTITVIKKNGSRVPFDRNKILRGLLNACEKRPISRETIDNLVSKVEKKVYNTGDEEVASTTIGELVMEYLEKVDHVAYVRFASVYREFTSAKEFVKEVKSLG